jgi:hypothetical protein
MQRLVVGLVVLAACGSGKSADGGRGGGGGGGGSKEVEGTLVVDGKPRTITKCIVERHLDTRITLVFAGGSVSYEDDDLYVYSGDDDDGIMRGRELTCGDLGGERSFGTSMKGGGWARGALRADCTAPVPVKLDVTLTCGTLSAEDQKDLDDMKARMRDTGGTLGGSAAPTDGDGGVPATGSAAPATGSAAPADAAAATP